MILAPTWSIALAAVAVSAALAGLGGLRAGMWWVQSDWDRQKASQAEQRRNEERRQETENRRIADDLSNAQRAGADARRLAAQRLRDLSAARDEAAAACSRLDAPAAGILPERTRVDLESLASRADDTARQLAACQAYAGKVAQ